MAMSWSTTRLLVTTAILCFIPASYSYSVGSFHLYGCQGQTIPVSLCSASNAVYEINSISVLTSSDVALIQNSSRECYKAEQCRRTIHSGEDEGLSAEYIYLYNWIQNRCNGRPTCEESSVMPEWWALIDTDTECGQGQTQHFVGALIDITCKVGEAIATVPQPPETTPKTRPTTPSTTTSFPVYIPIYIPELIGREKIILGVAIGLAIAILIVLLVVLYCCESYRHHKKFGKLLRMLGAPQAQNDGFDDFEDYATNDAWKDETDTNYDAVGEYTGVKPDEFLTLDKKAMESSGQIMYDSNALTMTMGRGNSCSTLSRDCKGRSFPSGQAPTNIPRHTGSVDYNTEENLELERRMAAVQMSQQMSIEEGSVRNELSESRTYH
ncbi:uncharacterized protein [Watersipora subatra]|uniref:uncharacterized protein n=1 Tax=Watersipora subatra TaxID=2589382 RepID=UPI00355BD4CD